MKESEEKIGLVDRSVEELFVGIQESYAEAQARAMEENRPFAKTEYFRLDKLGIYRLRIVPLAPNPDGTAERRTYEYPVRQFIMDIEKPAPAAGKSGSVYVTGCRATDAGYSIDLIDTYRKLAVAMAKDAGDEKLAEKINGGSFGGGLRYNYGHAMYILDLSERTKGLQLLTLSHAQFKELEERKFRLWEKKLAKNPLYPCPISSVYNAYPVEIEKRKNGSKTEYYISIDNESDNLALSSEELKQVMNAPRIPDVVYRYTRYHYEATLAYLLQCDQRYGLKVMDTQPMEEAIAQLGNELPKDDTSSFSFDKRSKDSRDNAQTNSLSLDSLYSLCEELKQKGIGDRTEEGQELRSMIRTFVEQEKLPVRITRTVTNEELLDMIDDAMSDRAAGGQEEVEETTAPAPRRR